MLLCHSERSEESSGALAGKTIVDRGKAACAELDSSLRSDDGFSDEPPEDARVRLQTNFRPPRRRRSITTNPSVVDAAWCLRAIRRRGGLRACRPGCLFRCGA